MTDHYWNRENFEGLLALAAALRTDARLEHLARYCELRERGLRRQAFAELDAFFANAKTWSPAVCRDVALTILELNRRTPEAHQFLSVPLQRKFIEPVLVAWRAEEPTNAIATRELGLFGRDQDTLRAALAMNPQDLEVRAAIVEALLQFVSYATHHLVEGLFIGDEADAASALDEAAALLEGGADVKAMRMLRKETEGLARLLADWLEYRKAPEGTFREWCDQRSRVHPWWGIFYYKA